MVVDPVEVVLHQLDRRHLAVPEGGGLVHGVELVQLSHGLAGQEAQLQLAMTESAISRCSVLGRSALKLNVMT